MGKDKNKKRKLSNRYWVGATALALFEIFVSYNAIKQEKNIFQYHKEIFQSADSFLKNKPILGTTNSIFYLTSKAPYKIGILQIPFENIVKSIENEKTIKNIESIINEDRRNRLSEVGGYLNFNKDKKEMDFYKCMSLNEELMLDLESQVTTEEKLEYLEYLYGLELVGYKLIENDAKDNAGKNYFLNLLSGMKREDFGRNIERIKKSKNKEQHLEILIDWLNESSKNSYIPSVEHMLNAYFNGNFGPNVLDFHIHSNSSTQGILEPSEEDIKKSYYNREIVLSDFGENHFAVYDIKNGKYDMVEWKNGEIIRIEKEIIQKTKSIEESH